MQGNNHGWCSPTGNANVASGEELAKRGAPLSKIQKLIGERQIKALPGRVEGHSAVKRELRAIVSSDNQVARHFTDRPLYDEASDKTYVIYKMWGVNTEPALEALAEAFRLPGLVRLDLCNNEIGEAGVAALAGCASLRILSGLAGFSTGSAVSARAAAAPRCPFHCPTLKSRHAAQALQQPHPAPRGIRPPSNSATAGARRRGGTGRGCNRSRRW